jgi:hypothetical protein
MSTVARPRAAIGAKKRNVPQVLVRSKAIYNAMLLNVAQFVSPTITMVALLALIQALELAQQNALTKGTGLAGIRDAKRDLLWTALESLCTYVQGLADTMVPASGIVLIESAGFLVSASGAHDKAILQAELVPATPGVVHLVANASLLVGKSRAKTQFNWQMSVDGKTWTNLPSTPLADTEVAGLALLSTYSFRVSVTLGKVVGEWTQAVSVTVH